MLLTLVPSDYQPRDDVVHYRVNSPVTNVELDALYVASWPDHQPPYDFQRELEMSLVYVCAYAEDLMVGFVRLAWDGGIHAFVLEPTVRPDFQRRGIGTELVARSVAFAHERNVKYVHVNYEPELRLFYEACGFTPTDAGLIRLR